MFTARRSAFLLSLVLVFYLVALGQRAVALMGDSRPALVVLGAALLVLPLVAAWLVYKELRFGIAMQRLAQQLEAEQALPTDDLPRLANGRIDRVGADAIFVQRKAETQEHPDDWRTWYRLGVAYGDAGDTTRGRKAMRHAIALFAGSR